MWVWWGGGKAVPPLGARSDGRAARSAVPRAPERDAPPLPCPHRKCHHPGGAARRFLPSSASSKVTRFPAGVPRNGRCGVLGVCCPAGPDRAVAVGRRAVLQHCPPRPPPGCGAGSGKRTPARRVPPLNVSYLSCIPPPREPL